MSDFKNPFDPDNFSLGIGWDGKTVTVTDSKFTTDLFTFGSGDPVLDDNGEQAYANVWAVTGISEDSEAERTEKYNIGKALVPTPDGDSFESKAGKPNATFHAKARAAKFAAALKESGFPLQNLVDGEGRPSAAGLIGAVIVFKGERVLDASGKPKVDKNGYEKIEFYPAKFEGFAKNAPKGKTVNADDAAIRNRAYDVVTNLLSDAEGNKLTRIALIQGLSKALEGDPEKNAIVQLAVSSDFNSAAPWKVEGTTISLN